MKWPVVVVLLVGTVGCGAVYPELVTTLHAPESGAVLEPPPADDLYYLYFEGAVVPARTRDGREWSSGGPSTYAKLKAGDSTLIQTPVEASTRKPSWPKQEPKNYRIPGGVELTVELWVADAIQDKPLCQVTVLDLAHLRDGGRSDFDCDSGAHISLGVEPAHAMIGLGFYYELRGAEGVRVTRVLKYSPASRGGLAEGTRIQTIQGKSVVPMDALEVRSAMNANSRAGVRLDVESSNGIRRVITLKDGPIYPLPEEGIDLGLAAMTFGFRAFSWNAIEATGSEAPAWLGGIVTSDVPLDKSAGGRWGLLLSKQGKIQAELVLTGEGSSAVSIAVRGGDAQAVREVLDHHLVMEDVELGPVVPGSWAILIGATAEDLLRLTETAWEVTSDPAPFGFAGTALVRSNGELSESCRALAGFGHELSLAEWEDARVEMGLPLFGVDYDAGDNPHQAALERRAVSWQKGCYLGQEVVFMQDARGKVKRRLARVVAVEPASWSVGARVTTPSGEEAGQVTTVGVGRALARLSAPYFEAGTSLLVGQVPVVVEALDAGRFGRAGAADRLVR